MDLSDEQVDQWVERKFSSLWPPPEWRPHADVGGALLARGQRPRFRRLQFTAVAAALLIGLFLVYPRTGVLAQRCVAACVAGTTSLGELLGITPKTVGYPTIGGPAPLFSVPDANGATVSLAALRGKVVILNFWATWCGPCQVEIPWFVEFKNRFEGQGFEVIGVSMDDDGWASVRPYLRERRLNYPVVLGDEQLSKMYGGIEAIPTTLVLDREGRIVAEHTGLVAKAGYESEILRLLEEK